MSTTLAASHCLLAIALSLTASSVSTGQNPTETSTKAEQSFQEAVTLAVIGNPKFGRIKFLDAMRLWFQAKQLERAARAAIQLGDSLTRGKKHEEALFCYNEALAVRPINPSIKALALSRIAKLYADLLLHEPASRYYQQAITQAGSARDSSTQAAALVGLADLLRQRGQRRKALDCITQARRLIRGKDDYLNEAALLGLAGQIDQEEGRFDRARQNFESALSIYRKSGDLEHQVQTLCALSGLSLASSQAQAALARAEQAVELADSQRKGATTNADKLIARESEWRALLSLGRAERALGHKAAAINSLKGAISQLEALFYSAYLSTEATAISFREQRQAPYRELVALTVELGKIKEAYNLAERAKARAILSMIEPRRQKGPLIESTGDETLREASRTISTLRIALISARTVGAERMKLERELKEAEYAFEEKRFRLEMERFRDRTAWFPFASIAQLQQCLFADNTAILEFMLGEDQSFAWLISSSEVSVAVLPGRTQIEHAVTRYLETINTAPSNFYLDRDLSQARVQAETLCATVLGGLAEKVAASRKLIVVPDGVLHYLPFEALIHKARYLVEDHEISYLPSASMLGLWDSANASPPAYKMQLLAFGDPLFGPEVAARAGRQPRTAGNVTRQIEFTRRRNLAPLPRTHDEVKCIADLFQPGTTRVYLGRDCTEQALKRESLRQYRRLHFGTHSLIDEATPSRSAVVLTQGSDPNEDGFLEVNEISELDLDCDLVVLSACQTGRGQLRSGEGIIGLTRAFLYAGARSVVVSLWSVSDISTGQFMKSFYQHLTADSGNAAALRLAKLEMLQGSAETRHPYYWAPFVAVGKPWG